MKPYQPRGKAKPLLEAMQGDPDKVLWTVPEVAQVLHVGVGEVMTYVLYPLKHEAMYRGKREGRVVFSLKPFPESEALPNRNTQAARKQAAAPWTPKDDPRIPRVDPAWRPPVMVPPRAGSAR